LEAGIPRSEYPRPQFVRSRWVCLNGQWEFEVDRDDTGLKRGLLQRPLGERITVPFCPESILSGAGDTGFKDCVWYRRSLSVPDSWAGNHVLLHFQAVDHDATVWVNGAEVARHHGGFTPFSADITEVVKPGETATVVVRARDPHDGPQARGKQSTKRHNHGRVYTRTTGIWQTVWMEPVPPRRLERPRLTPNADAGSILLEQPVTGSRRGLSVRASLRDANGTVATAQVPVTGLAARLTFEIHEERRRLWSPEDPHLYDIEIQLIDESDQALDSAQSYAGLRSVSTDENAICVNGRRTFLRFVLDQGYWRDGIMTAPSDAELEADIRRAIAAGFNGARLHQKVFEERYLHHADRLGFMVWGEFPDGGTDPIRHADPTLVTQWQEQTQRDYSHPSIIAWCLLNEKGRGRGDALQGLEEVANRMFRATKTLDATRPVLDASGWAHLVAESDLYDSHDYTQNHRKLARNHARVGEDRAPDSLPYRGQPYFVSEFGGTGVLAAGGVGYGVPLLTRRQFYRRFRGLVRALDTNPDIAGYCYTQLTDVFQERNGLYSLGRMPKFDLERLREVQRRVAAIELR
jgi:beta-galactosidase/beta-glucuronidase